MSSPNAPASTPDEDTPDEGTPPSPFHRLADFVALPRLGSLALSDEGRLVVSVAALGPDRKKWLSALWELDPSGTGPARRLTRSAPGESAPVFTPGGDLLFLSSRPDPAAAEDAGDPTPALWCLPAGGGEARVLVRRRSGVGGVAVAAGSGDLVVVSSTHPGADTERDQELREQRADAGVTAILHEQYPVRFWDHDLGPTVPHLFWVGQVPADPEAGAEPGPAPVRDLTPDAGMPQGSGDDLALSPDGTLLVRSEQVPDGPAGRRSRLVLVETATGTARVLADDPLADLSAARFSPDGRQLVCVRESVSDHAEPPDYTLLLVDVRTGATRDVTAGFDRWPSAPQFSADGSALYFLADDDARHALFRVDLAGGAPVRLTGDGAYSDLQVARDGSALYALRSSYASPAAPVRLDPTATGQDPEPLPAPGAPAGLPGTLRELDATAADGTRVQSWLVLPEGASAQAPAPLVLWVHGGPLMSWNSWSWRWNPWVLAARGYAVLLPNPALSQGFGQDFVRRGWGEWGEAPYTDLMAAVDAAEALPEVDETRTAAMGGSFGGYMANWIATQTDRFRAIVTHASLWNLDSFSATTDAGYYWQREFGDPLVQPQRYERNSPHRFAEAIRTPMLVVHGDKDFRVPIGEGLALWYDLQRRGVPSRFLYFPDENHWVLTPGNSVVWYETVLAFLAEHILGQEWQRPALL